MSADISLEQLNSLKSVYVNAIVNGLPLQGLVNHAAASISAKFVDMDADAFREDVISSGSKETWEQLLAAVEDNEQAAAAK